MDGYDVLEQLGEGSSGEAFLVRSKETGVQHVLKRIRTDLLTTSEREAAEREAVVLKSFDHPNITKFECSFISSDDDSVNIVMEPCEMTLDHLIDAMRSDQEAEAASSSGRPSSVGFPEHVLLEWMAEMASALQYLHARRVVHRDIKPSNIFVSRTHHLKLGDFGVCKVLSRKSMCANSVVGTPWYIAPEVLSDEPYDERSDVWSLGVVFYELCTLQRPFNGDNFLSVVRDITTKDVSRVSKLRSIDSRFDEVILPMLQKDPKKRSKAEDVLKHFVVQQNHPSHPSQDPNRSRVCQDTYKVELTLPKSLVRARSTPLDGAAVRSVSPPIREAAAPLRPSASASAGRVAPKPQQPQPAKKPPSPLSAIGVRDAPSASGSSRHERAVRRTSVVAQEPVAVKQQDDHTRRVRQARSKINMQELREKWSATQTSSDAADGPLVLVPRHPSSPESVGRERHLDPKVEGLKGPLDESPRSLQGHDAATTTASSSSSPPRSHTGEKIPPQTLTVSSSDGSLKAFLDDLLAQLDGQLTLESVDEAEHALLEFKKSRFGTY